MAYLIKADRRVNTVTRHIESAPVTIPCLYRDIAEAHAYRLTNDFLYIDVTISVGRDPRLG
jgi:hypothetical protein